MKNEKLDLLKFSTQVRELLNDELQISLGNMEILPFAEKLLKLTHTQSYNEGVMDAKHTIEKKMRTIIDEIDILINYDQ